MTSYQLRVLATFSRTEAFLKQSKEEVFSNLKTWELVEELREISQKINALSPVQSKRVSGMSSNNAQLERIFHELRAELLKITRTARALEDEMPQLRSLFTMTRSPSFRALAETARGFIRKSTPEIQARFIESEFPHDYLAVIERKLSELHSATGNRSALRTERATATTELKALFERGMVLLRKLDAAFRNKVTDPVRLEQWRAARNVELIHRLPSKRQLPTEASMPAPASPVDAEPSPVTPLPPEESPLGTPKTPPVIIPLTSPAPFVNPEGSPRKKQIEEAPPVPKKPIRRRQALSLQEDFFQVLNPEGA